MLTLLPATTANTISTETMLRFIDMRSLCKDGLAMRAAKLKDLPENKHQVKTASTRADLLAAAEAVFVREGYETRSN